MVKYTYKYSIVHVFTRSPLTKTNLHLRMSLKINYSVTKSGHIKNYWYQFVHEQFLELGTFPSNYIKQKRSDNPSFESKQKLYSECGSGSRGTNGSAYRRGSKIPITKPMSDVHTSRHYNRTSVYYKVSDIFLIN